MKAVNIKWDVTDGAEDMTKEDMDEILLTLPTEVEIPNYLITDDEDDLLDEVSDWLSDEYGFCHDGFELVNWKERLLWNQILLSQKYLY